MRTIKNGDIVVFKENLYGKNTRDLKGEVIAVHANGDDSDTDIKESEFSNKTCLTVHIEDFGEIYCSCLDVDLA